MNIQINKELLDQVNLEHLKSFVDFQPETSNFFCCNYGIEHYKLLALVASQINTEETVVDLGTLYGASALALHYNQNLPIKTYDINDCINLPSPQYKSINDIGKITRIMKDGIKDFTEFLTTPLIVLDVDPHDSIQEKELIYQLETHNYRGIVICDDIHLNEEMKDFWKNVTQTKYDATKYGHWSGTGIIVFDPTYMDVIIS